MFARSLLLYDFFFNHRNFHWEPASDLLFLKVFFSVMWVWESLFASGEIYRVCMSPAKIKKRRVMLQLHGSSALNFFFAWQLRRSDKNCIQHFYECRSCGCYLYRCLHNLQEDFAQRSSWFRLLPAYTGSAIRRSFLQWSAKVDHMLKIRGKIQALLDLVCDEFYRNDGPSLDRQKRVGHRSETFWGNGISQVLIAQKKNIVQLCSLDTALSGCHENESILPQSHFI